MDTYEHIIKWLKEAPQDRHVRILACQRGTGHYYTSAIDRPGIGLFKLVTGDSIEQALQQLNRALRHAE